MRWIEFVGRGYGRTRRSISSFPAIPLGDVRGGKPHSSSISLGFIRLKDLRDIALAEVEVCPDNGGWVAVGQARTKGQRPVRHHHEPESGKSWCARFSPHPRASPLRRGIFPTNHSDWAWRLSWMTHARGRTRFRRERQKSLNRLGASSV